MVTFRSDRAAGGIGEVDFVRPSSRARLFIISAKAGSLPAILPQRDTGVLPDCTDHAMQQVANLGPAMERRKHR